MGTSKNSIVVIPAKAGIQSPYRSSTWQAFQRVLDPDLRRDDDYTLKTQPKPVCRIHCHRATIFEVASAIWGKFFKKD